MPDTLTNRQQTLLSAAIKAYVRDAKPISSGLLADGPGLAISPATVRHELAALEEAGYLHQPYTSAGRVPTERAWKWYVSHLLNEREDKKPSTRRRAQGSGERKHLAEVIHDHRHTEEELLRQVAKTIADLAQAAVFVAYSKEDTYYTGLSNLFSQPEFETVRVLQHLSRVVDRLDDVLFRLYDRVATDIEVLIGHDNPVSSDCSTVVVRYRLDRHHGLIGIIGPLRQDYDEHVAMLRYTQEELQQLK